MHKETSSNSLISGRTPNSILIPIFPLKKFIPKVGQKQLEMYTCTEENYCSQLVRWLKWRYNVLIPFYKKKHGVFSQAASNAGNAKTQEIHMCGTPVMTWMGLERMSTSRCGNSCGLTHGGYTSISLVSCILKWIQCSLRSQKRLIEMMVVSWIYWNLHAHQLWKVAESMAPMKKRGLQQGSQAPIVYNGPFIHHWCWQQRLKLVRNRIQYWSICFPFTIKKNMNLKQHVNGPAPLLLAYSLGGCHRCEFSALMAWLLGSYHGGSWRWPLTANPFMV